VEIVGSQIADYVGLINGGIFLAITIQADNRRGCRTIVYLNRVAMYLRGTV